MEQKLNQEQTQTRCGFVTIVGKPNVGKSTLLNALVNAPISIATRKAQTTRHIINGILTKGNNQIVLVDTPGVQSEYKSLLNATMNQNALSKLNQVDAILFLVDATHRTKDDFLLWERIKKRDNVIVIMNKVDLFKNRNEALPEIEKLMQELGVNEVKKEYKNNIEIIPISAYKFLNLDYLIDKLIKFLPYSEFLFPKDKLVDKELKFIMAEIIRKHIILNVHEEIPYGCGVWIENFKKDERGVNHIDANIMVSNSSHKRIIIGKQGNMLKKIGSAARIEIATWLETKVMLRLWIKIKKDWMNRKDIISQMDLS